MYIPIVDQIFLLLDATIDKLVVIQMPGLLHEEVSEVIRGSNRVQIVWYSICLDTKENKHLIEKHEALQYGAEDYE